MKNLRYLITVLALVNAGLVAQAAAAPSTSTDTTLSVSKTTVTANKVSIGTE
jgi:hypothetical protein